MPTVAPCRTLIEQYALAAIAAKTTKDIRLCQWHQSGRTPVTGISVLQVHNSGHHRSTSAVGRLLGAHRAAQRLEPLDALCRRFAGHRSRDLRPPVRLRLPKLLHGCDERRNLTLEPTVRIRDRTGHRVCVCVPVFSLRCRVNAIRSWPICLAAGRAGCASYLRCRRRRVFALHCCTCG